MIDASEIVKAARVPRKKGRSEVFWFLWDRYSALADELGHGSNWEAITVQIATSGIRDGNGSSPTKRTVRDTWAKVKMAKSGERRTRKSRVKKSAVNRHFRKSVG